MHRIHLHRKGFAGGMLLAAAVLGALLVATGYTPWSAAATADRAERHAHRHATAAVADPDREPKGVTLAALRKAHWDCLFVVHAVHCLRPGGLEAATAGSVTSFTALVFDTRDPDARSAPLLGTEFNIRSDVFNDQPCPTDPPSRQYTYLPDIGVPIEYFACHRFDSPL
jgi:hypothetical protein